MTENTWFYESDGDSVGPVSEDQINSLISENVLQAETLVWTQGESDWRPAKDFFSFQRQTPPPLPHKKASATPSAEADLALEDCDQTAFQKGYVARVSGRSLMANPFTDKKQKTSWHAGWLHKDRSLSPSGEINVSLNSNTESTKTNDPSYLRLFAHLVLVAFIMLVLSSAANVTVSELDQQGYDPSLLGSGAVLQALFIGAIAYAIAEFKGQYIKRIWQVTSVAIAVYLLLIFVALSLVGST